MTVSEQSQAGLTEMLSDGSDRRQRDHRVTQLADAKNENPHALRLVIIVTLHRTALHCTILHRTRILSAL